MKQRGFMMFRHLIYRGADIKSAIASDVTFQSSGTALSRIAGALIPESINASVVILLNNVGGAIRNDNRDG